MLESGEYFGESGVITFSNGGSKATAAQPAVTEQFSLVAGTNVELLVLRRKHFNIIEMPVSLLCTAIITATVSSATQTCKVFVHGRHLDQFPYRFLFWLLVTQTQPQNNYTANGSSTSELRGGTFDICL